MAHDGMNGKLGRDGIGIDLAKYQAMIDDPSLSEEQKRRFVEALWVILMTFVDLGFDLHSAKIACGQLVEDEGSGCSDGQDVLDLDDILRRKFEDAASRTGQRRREESEYDS